MRSRLRTAIVGCGLVGRIHAEALRALPGSDLVAVFDPTDRKARAFSGDYGGQPYSDLEEMLRMEHLDMVSVCSPHPAHPDAVVRAAQHGVHVLVEKPLAADLAGCDVAIAACARANVKLGVVSQRRLYPPVIRLRRAIDSGSLGVPVLGTVTVLGWRDKAYYDLGRWRGTWHGEGGGVLMNQSAHQLDLLLWFMGPIDELCGRWDNFSHPYIPVDDTAVAIIRFRSGALGSIVVSNAQNPGLYGNVHVHGSSGASVGVQTEVGSSYVAGVTDEVLPAINDIWTVPGEEHLLASWQDDDRVDGRQVDIMAHYHRLQIADFLSSIIDDRPPMVGGDDGRGVVELVTGLYRSQRDSRPITYPLQAEVDRADFDGRLTYTPYSRRERD